MSSDNLEQVILDEQKFPYANMTLEERNYYLNIIKNCKDICDSDNKIDGIGGCQIVKLEFDKKDNIVHVNGLLTLGYFKEENRIINAYIFLEEDKILVDMRITRLCTEDVKKEYTVFDKFTLENGVLKRKSQYNYDTETLYDVIENEEMKGRLK